MVDYEKVQKQAHDFLMDLDTRKELQALQKEIGGQNIFSILRTERTEIRHSNVLAYLLDPFANHGLDTEFAEIFFTNVASALKDKKIDFDIADFTLNNLEEIIVYREKANMDILIVTKDKLVAIENKTGSALHDSRITSTDSGEDKFVSQLEKYKAYIDTEYPKHHKLFLYLDSNKNFGGDIGEWHFINYSVVQQTLEYFADSKNITDKILLILNDYLENIRRNLMGEITPKTQSLCDSIYRKYKDVIDFIYKNNSFTKEKFHENLRELLKANANELNIEIQEDWCTSTLTRFRPKGIIVESELDKRWVGNQIVLFEISGNATEGTAEIFLVVYNGAKSILSNKIAFAFPKEKGQFFRLNKTKIKWDGTQDVSELVNELQKYFTSPTMQDIIGKIKTAISK